MMRWDGSALGTKQISSALCVIDMRRMFCFGGCFFIVFGGGNVGCGVVLVGWGVNIKREILICLKNLAILQAN